MSRPQWPDSTNSLSREPGTVHCASAGLTTLGRVLDHVTPVEQGGGFYDVSNLQELCDQCHNRKRQRERGR